MYCICPAFVILNVTLVLESPTNELLIIQVDAFWIPLISNMAYLLDVAITVTVTIALNPLTVPLANANPVIFAGTTWLLLEENDCSRIISPRDGFEGTVFTIKFAIVPFVLNKFEIVDVPVKFQLQILVLVVLMLLEIQF